MMLSGVACCAVWVLGNMIPFWYLLKVCGLLRATADEEALGLDSSHHVSMRSLSSSLWCRERTRSGQAACII